MKVGDLVRHVIHKANTGIVTKVGVKGSREIRVLWHDGDHSWIIRQRMEVA